MPQRLEFEGTWEEISSHAKNFAGRKVRLTVLPAETPTGNSDSDTDSESSISFWENETSAEIFSRQGIHPITTLTTLLESLPDFGEDAILLREAIAENRLQRRTLSGDLDC